MRGAQAKAAPGRFNQVAIAPMLLLHLAAATKPQPFTLTLMRQVEKNFLFRGPEQTVLGMWDDAGLRLQMRLLAPSLPHDFHLVDLCLLNAVDDVPAEDIERRYFAHHPDKGRFVWWPTNGTKLDAFNVSVASRAAAVRAWRPNSSWIDPLPWWVDEIDELLHTPRADNRSTVVFIHCHGGKDRTGEVAGSYYMRHMNMTLQEATTRDHQIAGRSIGHYNQLALEWYCIWLREVLRYPLTCPKPIVERIVNESR